ncbi:MAG: VCBS repeat-containing protein [Planctomycetaceae bacterium]|nr:VCBS repeat-containing protein [Planctomycetaceae bacterium]
MKFRYGQIAKRKRRYRLRLETLEHRLVLAGFDFGDAPTSAQSGFEDSYPTSLNEDGAAHLAVGPRLGSNRTDSTDGQPAIAALGDTGINSHASFEEGELLQLAQGDRLAAIQAADFNRDGVPDVIAVGGSPAGLVVATGRPSGGYDEERFVGLDQCLQAEDLRVGDFNNDGNADAATVCHLSSQVQVVLGAGDGTFGEPMRMDLNGGQLPRSLAVADFDLDGNLDLVTANVGSADASVLFGIGDGSFSNAINLYLPTGTYVYSVAAGDMDGDGSPDIAVVDYSDESVVSVFYSNSDQTFELQPSFPLGGSRVVRVVATDVDQDGLQDLVTANIGSSDISILLGTSNREFQIAKRVWLGASVYPVDVVASDLDLDGHMDLAALSRFQGDISVSMGKGDLEFTRVGSFGGSPNTTQHPGRMAAVDLDQNGTKDLLVTNDSIATAFLATRGGEFGFPLVDSLPSGESPVAVAVADFNSDGIPDVATATRDGVAVAFGGGGGSFGDVLHLKMPLSVGTQDIAAIDLNHDMRMDLVVVQGERDSVSIYLGYGDGRFSEEMSNWLTKGHRPQSFALADYDDDGNVDIVTANSRSDNASLLLGNGDGSFQPERIIDFGEINAPQRVIAADFNGDGAIDLAALSGASSDNDVSVVLNDGVGDFGDALHSRSLEIDRNFNAVAGDLDLDGHIDLLVVDRISKQLAIWWGKGDGQFAAEVLFQGTDRRPEAVGITDWDEDGVPDIVVTNSTQSEALVFYGMGDRNFEAPSENRLALGTLPRDLAIADLDGNGRADVITANAGSHDVAVLLNLGVPGASVIATQAVRSPIGELVGYQVIRNADLDGDSHADVITIHPHSDDIGVQLGDADGSFRKVMRFRLPEGASPIDGVLGDLNQDGHIDLATANTYGDSVSIVNGIGDGSFESPRTVETIEAPYRIEFGDFNRDGWPDLVVASAKFDKIAILLGKSDSTLQTSLEYELVHGSGDGILDLAVGDFDGDGQLDVATVNEKSNNVSLLLGRGDGTISAERVVDVAHLADLRTLASGDLNRDGRHDLFVTAGNGAGVLLGGPAGAVLHATLALPDDSWNRIDVRVEDVDTDGKLDVVVTHTFASYVLRGNGDGSLRRAIGVPSRQGIMQDEAQRILAVKGSQSSLNKCCITELTSSALADFNRDGLVDLAIAHAETDDLSVLLGQSGGAFVELQPIELLGDEEISDMLAIDFDQDGNVDLVTANTGSAGWSLFRGRGDGRFFDPLEFREAPVQQIVAADLNNDGHMDLAGVTGAGIAVWTTLPSGRILFEGFVPTFGSASFAIGPPQLQAEDIDSDDKLDLVQLDRDGAVRVFKGDGNGSFSVNDAIDDVSGGNYQRELRLGDLNNDGNADFVTWHSYSDLIALQVGKGDGTFEAQVEIAIGTEYGRVFDLADVNQDGYLDIILAAEYAREVDVLLNRGDGTFLDVMTSHLQRMHRIADMHVSDLNHDGQSEIVLITAEGVVTLSPVGDDDGITWLGGGELKAGGNGFVEIDLQNTESQVSYLDAWIDFNRDGDWSDEGEQIFDRLNLGTADGQQAHSFPVPANAIHGTTYARFRVSSTGGLEPTGVASDGEVEDYQVNVVSLREVDYGDAPTAVQSGLISSYPTRIAERGASHIIGGPRLGSAVDAEPDGQPQSDANGDASGPNDDGIVFGNLSAGQPGQANVVVTGADGRLDAWIDFNRDGDWDDPGEQIAMDYLVRVGSGRWFTFDIPEDAAGLPTYARFRISSAGRLAPQGPAPDGEVEDYRLTIAPYGTVDVDLTTGARGAADVRIFLEESSVVVTDHGVKVARIPASDITTVIVKGTPGDDSFVVDLPATLGDSIRVDGGDGDDLLRWFNAASSGKLKNGEFQAFERVDLRNSQSDAIHLLEIDAPSTPAQLFVTTDVGDVFSQRGGWQLRPPRIQNGEFYRVVERTGVSLLIKSAAPWQNPLNVLDVSGNSGVEPLDVLLVINVLNSSDGRFASSLPNPTSISVEDFRYFDTSGDGAISPLDALLVINYLNRPQSEFAAESESSYRGPTIASGVAESFKVTPIPIVYGPKPYEQSLPETPWPAAIDVVLSRWTRDDFDVGYASGEVDALVDLGLAHLRF